MVVFVQMSFGGHVHKAASDQLQKKLQEEAMADGADNLAAGMAGACWDGHEGRHVHRVIEC